MEEKKKNKANKTITNINKGKLENTKNIYAIKKKIQKITERHHTWPLNDKIVLFLLLQLFSGIQTGLLFFSFLILFYEKLNELPMIIKRKTNVESSNDKSTQTMKTKQENDYGKIKSNKKVQIHTNTLNFDFFSSILHYFTIH